MIDHFLRDASGVLFCQFCSTVLQCFARLPIHTLNYWIVQSVVPGSQLGVCLSLTLLIVVAVLCMLYKFRCNPMQPLNDALPGQCEPERVTRGAVVAHRYTYAPPRCRTSRHRRTFVPLSVSLWYDLADPVFDGVGLAGFKSGANAYLLA